MHEQYENGNAPRTSCEADQQDTVAGAKDEDLRLDNMITTLHCHVKCPSAAAWSMVAWSASAHISGPSLSRSVVRIDPAPMPAGDDNSPQGISLSVAYASGRLSGWWLCRACAVPCILRRGSFEGLATSVRRVPASLRLVPTSIRRLAAAVPGRRGCLRPEIAPARLAA